MPTLKLRLWLFPKGGGLEFGLARGMPGGIPVLAFNVQGGKVQPLHHGQYIDNDMMVAEELKDGIFRRNLFVVRDSDAVSLELYQAFKKRNKFMVLAAITSVALGGIEKHANLLIRHAYIKEFKTGSTQFDDGRPGRKNQDGILFSFESRNADISFGSNSEEIFKREVAKIAGAIAGSVAAIGKKVGL